MLRPVGPSRRRRPLPRGARPARATRRPISAILVALGLLIAQGPVLLHLLLVPHATCEHGELVERVAARRDDGAPTPPRAERAHGDRPQIERARDGREGHEHCDALAVRHRLADVGAAIVGADVVWIDLVEQAEGAPETRPVPLLALAPKSSPPA